VEIPFILNSIRLILCYSGNQPLKKKKKKKKKKINIALLFPNHRTWKYADICGGNAASILLVENWFRSRTFVDVIKFQLDLLL
jgi:hypothetical protein